jgi:hypothetical protein
VNEQNKSDGSWPMARNERQGDGIRSGVGTMTPPGTRPRPRRPPETAAAAPDPRRGRPVPPPRPTTDQQAGPVQRPDGTPRPAGRPDQRVPSQRPAANRSGAAQAVAVPARSAAPARPGMRLRTGAPWRAPRADPASGPQPARTTGPQPAVPRAEQARAAQPGQVAQLRQRAAVTAGSHRMPFVLLLCGLLGGALVSALVISTTLAEGSFQITKLQNSTSTLAKQRQALEEEVAQAQSAQTIAQRASQLGMRRPGELRFVDLKTGKTSNDGPTWSGAVNAPGYAP